MFDPPKKEKQEKLISEPLTDQKHGEEVENKKEGVSKHSWNSY